MYFRGKEQFGSGPTPVDQLVEFFDRLLETRGLPRLEPEEKENLREIASDYADQIEQEAYSRATRTGDYDTDY